MRQVAILVQPVMPASAGKLLDLLAVPADERSFAALGGGAGIAPGTALPAPAPVFPRYVEAEASAHELTMLVDSHCHLDFPDFAGDRDGVVGARPGGRRRRAWSRSRRACEQLDELMAIAERFPDVFCSVGTHPHNAHEELDVTRRRPRAAARSIPRWSRSARPGLDYHYDNSPRDAQERGFRPTSPRRARPACRSSSMRARPTTTWRAILEEETGKGRLPGRPALLLGGPDLARRGVALGLYDLVLRHPHLQEGRGAARDRGRAAGGPHPGRDRRAVSRARPHRGKRNEPAYVVETAKVLAEVRGVTLRRDRAPDDGEFLPAVLARCRACAAVQRPSTRRRMTLTLHHPRLRLVRRRAAAGAGWGACDPDNPKNRRRRCSLLVERRDGAGRHPGARRHLAGPARAAARRRASTGSTPCSSPTSTPTTRTASTTCAASFMHQRKRVDGLSR